MKKIVFTAIAIAAIVCVVIYARTNGKVGGDNGQVAQWEKHNNKGEGDDKQDNLYTESISSSLLKEGDIVFQISKSSQSPFIMNTTKSPWSHCGVIIEKDRELYVLEASNVVKLTPYEEWKNRGALHIVSSKRVINEPVKVKYSKYIGIPYDSEFKLDDNKYYCSELVWKIYKDQFGIVLSEPHRISDYNITDEKTLRLMKSRGIKQSQLIIAPVDIYENLE